MEIRIEVDNIGKSFGEKLLFSNVFAEIVSGQCLTVTGCNGCGKSTFLKIIAGLVRPTVGQVRLLLDNRPSPKAQLYYMGLVSPEVSMYAALTGIENIIFWTKMRGVPCSKEEAEKLCQQMGLGKAGCDLVATYSTGMRQRLKLAVIKAINPPIWLLDEPSSNLDINGRELVKELIFAAISQNVVVILATNESGEALYGNSTIKL